MSKPGAKARTELPRGYEIRRTIFGYVGGLKGKWDWLWESQASYDREKVVRACQVHWAETCDDVDYAIWKAKQDARQP